ncbi:MAG: ABC transporter permease [Actinobacteria bacterium]|nr:ABC transporter permease [Actinomycetota bacterium]
MGKQVRNGGLSVSPGRPADSTIPSTAGDEPALQTPPSDQNWQARISRLPVRQLLLIGSFLVMVLVFSLAKPDGFPTSQNVKNLINELPILGMLAISVTVVLVLGEFDLSVPNVAALSTVVVSILTAQAGFGVAPAILVALLVAALAGTVNGVGVGYGKASAFVVTLAVGSVAAGTELFVQGRIDGGLTQITRLELPAGLLTLSNTRIAGIELAVIVFLLIALVIGLILVHSPWGRHVQAIGGNEVAARLAGVPVRRDKVIAFVTAGALAGIAGVLFAARQGYFSNALPPYLLPAYAAAFFGAAAVGRRGFSVPATLFGVLYLSTLSNGLRVMNEPLWVISVIQGVILLVTVLLARAGWRRA